MSEFKRKCGNANPIHTREAAKALGNPGTLVKHHSPRINPVLPASVGGFLALTLELWSIGGFLAGNEALEPPFPSFPFPIPRTQFGSIHLSTARLLRLLLS